MQSRQNGPKRDTIANPFLCGSFYSESLRSCCLCRPLVRKIQIRMHITDAG
jgi:hypothetical protein